MWNTEQAIPDDLELANVIGAIHRLEAECINLATRVESGVAADEVWHGRLADFMTAFDTCVAACKQFVACQADRHSSWEATSPDARVQTISQSRI
jgi:hypothetical protein